ncbi:unnamed protein product [Closterium sp. NIES-64]|nr:unnamed protein product [Closterium sp. NIES-64]
MALLLHAAATADAAAAAGSAACDSATATATATANATATAPAPATATATATANATATAPATARGGAAGGAAAAASGADGATSEASARPAAVGAPVATTTAASHHHFLALELYMLSWLSLVGRIVGMQMPPCVLTRMAALAAAGTGTCVKHIQRAKAQGAPLYACTEHDVRQHIVVPLWTGTSRQTCGCKLGTGVGMACHASTSTMHCPCTASDNCLPDFWFTFLLSHVV